MRLLVLKSDPDTESPSVAALINVIPDDDESPGIRFSPSVGLEVSVRSAMEAQVALDALRVKHHQLLRQQSGNLADAGQRLIEAGGARVGAVRRGTRRFRNATSAQISESLQLQSHGTNHPMSALILAIDLSSGIDDAIDLIGDAIGALGDILGELA